MNTPNNIIAAVLDPFIYGAHEKAKNILDALELGGYCVMQKRAWPHSANTEVFRDGEMRAM